MCGRRAKGLLFRRKFMKVQDVGCRAVALALERATNGHNSADYLSRKGFRVKLIDRAGDTYASGYTKVNQHAIFG